MEPINVGNQLWRLTILSATRKNNRSAWVCECVCGKQTVVRSDYLRSGKTRSCGCLRIGAKAEDLSGQQFGQLTAISPVRKTNKPWRLWWNCRCACGNMTIIRTSALKAGVTKSCGCARRKLQPNEAQKNRAYRGFLNNAKQRNIPIEISSSGWEILVKSPCYYCGVEYSNECKPADGNYGISFFYNGVDRLNPNQGYTKNNCVACCKHCNDSKGIMTSKQFIDLVLKIAMHHSGHSEGYV